MISIVKDLKESPALPQEWQGIIHRSESHEHRMVFTAILCRTGFAACLYTRQDCADHTAGCTTRTTCNSGTHPLHNFIVIFPVD